MCDVNTVKTRWLWYWINAWLLVYMIISRMKYSPWIEAAASAAAECIGYYLSRFLGLRSAPRRCLTSNSRYSYLLAGSQGAFAQRFDVFQLFVVLAQLLGHHHSHLEMLAIVLVVSAVAVASRLFTELHLLWFFLILVSAARSKWKQGYLEWEPLLLRLECSRYFFIGLMRSRSLSMAARFSFSNFSRSSFSCSLSFFSDSSASIRPSSSLASASFFAGGS